MKQPFRYAVLAVIVWSVGMAILMAIGLNRFNLGPDNAYNWMTDQNVNHIKQWEYVVSLWDGRWYIELSKNGYQFDPDGLSNVAFLPLFPFLLRVLTIVTHSHALSGLIINFCSLIGAVYFLIRLAREEKMNEPNIRDAVLFLLIYPAAIFFAATYTEALFVFLTTACFYFCKRNRFWIAAIFGFLAALTRIPGLFLFFPFAYYLWKSKRPTAEYLAVLAMPLGTGLYLLLQKLYTGHALAFLTAQQNWGRKFFEFNPNHVYWQTSAGVVNSSLDIMFAALLLASIWYIWKKMDIGYAVYTACVILVPLATGSLMSIGRFGLVLFPIALAMAQAPAPIKKGYQIVSIVLLTMYTFLFVNGYWAG